jgi:hypothetical protein
MVGAELLVKPSLVRIGKICTKKPLPLGVELRVREERMRTDWLLEYSDLW